MGLPHDREGPGQGSAMAERLPLVAKGAGDGEEEEEGEADEQVGLATGDRDDSRSLRFYVELFVVVTLFMTLGPALILVNKTILTDMHFPYPILVSAVGQAAAWLMTLVVYRITCSMELTMAHKVTWRFYLVNMGTIGAGTACALALGQAVYFYLTGARAPRAVPAEALTGLTERGGALRTCPAQCPSCKFSSRSCP